MLDKEGHIRLIDFGLSKVGVSENPEHFTRTLCGTNSYMAPEVILFTKQQFTQANNHTPIQTAPFNILISIDISIITHKFVCV